MLRKGILTSLVAGLAGVVVLIGAGPASAATVIDTTVLPYDVSYPQCTNMPASTPVVPGIVGINAGTPMSVNPCLADQLTWAGGVAASFYINTANPGPALSKFWPNSQATPQLCDSANPDSLPCAYDYGYNFAENAFTSLAAAFTAGSLTLNPATITIWLDVETSNTWGTDVAKNVQVLQGAIDNLHTTHSIGSVGLYSTTRQWGEITGGSQQFAALPFWGAGAATALTATDICAAKVGPNGGPIQLVQFVLNGFDQNLICASAAKISAKLSVRVPKSIKHGKSVTVKATLKSETGAPVANAKVTISLGKKKYSAVTGITGVAKVKITAPAKPGMQLVIISAAGGGFYVVTSSVSSTQIK